MSSQRTVIIILSDLVLICSLFVLRSFLKNPPDGFCSKNHRFESPHVPPRQTLKIDIPIPMFFWHLDVSQNGGTPIARWFIYVYFMENPKMKWMRTGSTATSGNLHL